MTPFAHRVYTLLAHIPSGKVTSYGQLAMLAGCPGAARSVGRLMSQAPSHLPWHRVVTSDGRMSCLCALEQQAMLKSEGITINNGRVSMKQYRWDAEISQEIKQQQSE